MDEIKSSDISIVIPVFNEEDNIVEVIRGVREMLGAEAEILVVDDASTDSTPELLKREGVRVISHPYNKGNGAAVKTGIRNASKKYIVLMDGDGQHPPENIPKLLEHLDRYEMVVGARDSGTVQSLGRGPYNKSLNMFASYITGIEILDLTSGFRAMPSRIARGFVHLLPNTFSYPTTITMSMLRAGYNVKFVPMRFEERRGHSKIRPFRDGLRFLVILLRIASIFSPLKVFMPISVFFFGGGLLYYLYTFLRWHRFTNLALFMLSTGVIVFVLGLVAEQISLLRSDRVEDDVE